MAWNSPNFNPDPVIEFACSVLMLIDSTKTWQVHQLDELISS